MLKLESCSFDLIDAEPPPCRFVWIVEGSALLFFVALMAGRCPGPLASL
jgi:hypothetical protein